MSSGGSYSNDEAVSREKTASAYRTIGEASEELGVPQHVLRFWEKRFSQLEPVKRRGRRYYRPEDLELLQQIKGLLYQEGYTIKGVQKYLANDVASDDEEKNQADLFGGNPPSNNNHKSKPAPEKPSLLGSSMNAIPRQMLKTVLSKLHIANERLKDAL